MIGYDSSRALLTGQHSMQFMLCVSLRWKQTEQTQAFPSADVRTVLRISLHQAWNHLHFLKYDRIMIFHPDI